MPYRSFIIVTLIAALAFVSFRWYQCARVLAVCGQDIQAAQRLMASCQPVIERNSHVIFQDGMKYLMAYPTETGKRLLDKFRCLDTLHIANLDSCDRLKVAVLPKIVNTFADHIRTFTDQDSLIGILVQKTVQDGRFKGEYTDTLLRQQAKLQLSLLKHIAFNYLCLRISRPDMIFDSNYPFLAPLQIEARLGQPFEASIVLSNPSHINNSRIDVTVNGEVCPLARGIANFKTTFQRPGLNELHLKVATINLFTGQTKTSNRTVAVLVKA